MLEPANLLYSGYRAGGRSVKLTTHLHRVPTFIKSGAAPPECSSRCAWTVVRIQYGSLCSVCRTIVQNLQECFREPCPGFSRFTKLQSLVHLTAGQTAAPPMYNFRTCDPLTWAVSAWYVEGGRPHWMDLARGCAQWWALVLAVLNGRTVLSVSW